MYNANNYGYNPYGTYIPQRPLQQPLQTSAEICRAVLNGKQVDSLEVVKAVEYPLDGSVSYFPLVDGSAIVTKQLTMDGTSKTIIYKPVTEEPVESPKYVTSDELNTAIEKIDLSEIEDIKDELRELRQEFKDFKKKKKDD